MSRSKVDSGEATDGPGFDDLFRGTDRFELRRRLGSGGMGVVYEAYDRKRDERVALKMMNGVSASQLYLFKREFRALADVVHPNLVCLHELMSVGERWFFTMELVEGVDFLHYVRGKEAPDAPSGTDSQLPPTVGIREGKGTGPRAPPLPDDISGSAPATVDLSAKGPLPSAPPVPVTAPLAAPPLDLDRLREAVRQLAGGLEALHAAGKLHCDIKPSNVRVTREGRVVLLDFGVVTDVSRSSRREQSIIAGTPDYMSPEQAAGKPLSPATDWYSVGVMLYRALTGRLPLPPGYSSWTELVVQKAALEPVPPRQLVPGTPPALEELCLALLRQRPEDRPSARQVLQALDGSAAPLSPSPSPVVPVRPEELLIGRGRHLAALADAFAQAKQGHTVVVYVHGISGMGKSALVRHFLEGLTERREAVVLEGRCYERESLPYKGLDSLIDALSHHLSSLDPDEVAVLLPRHLPALVRMFPVLEQVKAIASAPRGAELLDPQEARRRAFGALRELLARMADRRPLVLHVDDLQWSDLDSAALLDGLVRPPDAPTLLLLGSVRSEARATSEAVRALPKPGGPLDVRELAVEALAPGEARELVLALLGPQAAPEADTIAREAGGSPFFVQELARHLQESAGAGLRSAGTLNDVLAFRLARLPEEARRLLRHVAVAARPIPEPVARKAAGLPPEDRAALAMLRASRLVRVQAGRGQDELETFHDRIREAVVAQLPEETLRECHLTLATVLEASGKADPESLADHFARGGEKGKAAEYAFAAAEAAERALAFDRAAKLYRFAVELQPPGDPGTPGLQALLGDALANAGRCVEAARAYLKASQGADRSTHLELHRRAAEQFLISGHIDDGIRVIGEVLSEVGLELPRTRRRALLSFLKQRVRLKLRGLKFGAPRAVSEQELLRMDLCWAVTRGLAVVDSLRASDFQTRHFLMALDAGDRFRITRGMAMEAAFLATPGGATKRATEAVSRAARELAAEVGHPYVLGLATMTAGAGAYLRGEWQRGVELCEQAEVTLREKCTGVVWELSSTHRFALGCLMYLGHWAELRRRVHVLLVAAQERGNLYAATDIRTRYNGAWLAADELDEAQRQVDTAVAEWNPAGFFLQHYSTLLAQTQLDLYRGNGEAAWRRMEEKWPLLARSLLLRIQIVRIEGLHLRARAALQAAEEKGSAALLRLAEQDAKRLERERMHWSTPLAALIRAGVASCRGDRVAAERLLVAAAEGCDRAEMGLYAAAARYRLAELVQDGRSDELRSNALAFMAGQQIKNPARLVGMLVPGFRGGPAPGR